MKKIIKISYIIRIILFLIHFYFIFIMLDQILDTKYFGPIFLVAYLGYTVWVLFELISKKKKYKSDLVYNIMQIGLYAYLMVLSIRVSIYNVYVEENTHAYFITNYVILTILLIFICIYSYVEFKNMKKVWDKDYSNFFYC